MKCKKFDVVIVEFPFIDNPLANKIRPCVIVSSNNYIKDTGYVIVAMITTAKRSSFWGDIKITDHENLHLHPASKIRMKFLHMHKEDVLKVLGKLNVADRKILRGNLRSIF